MRVFIAVLSIMLIATTVSAVEDTELKTQNDRVSYGIGMDIGGSLKNQYKNMDFDMFMKGMKDAFLGNETLMTDQEVRKTMSDFKKKLKSQHEKQKTVLAEKNSKEGNAFLMENKKEANVTTLSSGLQYMVIKEGSGDIPKSTDTVTVNYRGTLIDGTEFDSSGKRGQPATFKVKGVIAGWTEALQLMKIGSKWKLFLPSNIAYGERGAGGKIGPNATLIFEVELLSIN